MWNWRRYYVLVSISYLPGLWAVGCPLLSSLPLAPLTHSQRLKPSSRPEPARAVLYRLDCGLWSPPEPPGRIIKIEKLNRKHLTSHLSYISPPLPSLLLTLVWNSDLYNWEDCANNQCQSCNLVFHQRNKNFPASMEQIRAELDILTIILVEGTETAPAAGHWYSTWL